MTHSNELLFLGTGGSMGIPVIGCHCEVCQSNDPRNQRSRPGALLKVNGMQIVVDAGPDFRTQALAHGIDHIEGVIFTHAHHDHTAGIDDLRVYYMMTGKGIPCLMSLATYQDVRVRYDYIFSSKKNPEQLTSRIDLHLLEQGRGVTDFLGTEVCYFTYDQAGMAVNGFRIGEMAYVSDIREYPETIFEDLKGVSTLVLSALRFTPSRLHFSVDEAVDFAKKVNPRKTWLIHIAHDLDHEKTNAYLPSNIRLAYDGLQIRF